MEARVQGETGRESLWSNIYNSLSNKVGMDSIRKKGSLSNRVGSASQHQKNDIQ